MFLSGNTIDLGGVTLSAQDGGLIVPALTSNTAITVGQTVLDAGGITIGDFTLGADPTGLTIPVGATVALIQAETHDVRWRDDGTAPTASVGMYLGQGATLPYTGNLNAVQFIQVSAGAKLNISYYG